MARVMAQNPKFRNSEFFDFVSKVSTGELKFENNEVVPGIPSVSVYMKSYITIFNLENREREREGEREREEKQYREYKIQFN
jgi:hypothetical protein